MDVDVGARLRKLRKMHGLSQRELAKRAGVTNGMISLIEQNRASPSVSSLKNRGEDQYLAAGLGWGSVQNVCHGCVQFPQPFGNQLF